MVGWLGENGGHGFDRCLLWVVLSPGAAGAGAAGSAPVRDCGFVFLSSFVFLFLVCIYVYNQFL